MPRFELGCSPMGKDAFFRDDYGHGWYLHDTHPALEGDTGLCGPTRKAYALKKIKGMEEYADCNPLAFFLSCPPWVWMWGQSGMRGDCIRPAEENHPARKFVKRLNDELAEEALAAQVSAQGMNNDINKVAPEPMATPQIVTMAARTSSQEVETMPGGVAKFVCTNPVLARASADVNDKLPDLEANTLAEGVQILASEEGDGKWLRCASEGPFKGFYFPFYDQKTQNLMTHRPTAA
ncbi:hypothetical protein PPROV_000230800 [Pycnococcus provasolii]|uniref:Uncharacterized protein n=1 Tax=Pycnococcus provasolii TaxID=41880 RepID=A0A830HAR7_9CHLO|nr:hypothetical protein PPROV_000230800 [Pycnococcus provasolii]